MSTANVTQTGQAAVVSVTVSRGLKGDTGATGAPGTTDYNELDNVPSEFPPEAHTHPVSDITPISSGKLVGRHGGGSGAGQEIGLDGGLEFQGANIRREALTGDVTAAAGSNATTIANDAVTNAKLANVPTATIKGRITAGTGDPEDLTPAQAIEVIGAATPASVEAYAIPLSSASLIGGANKIPQYGADGLLQTGPTTNDGLIASKDGAVHIPKFRYLGFLDGDGNLGAGFYFWPGHSGGDEVVASSPRWAWYWNDGMQFGSPATLRDNRYIYIQPNTATVTDTLVESPPVGFNSRFWNGAASVTETIWLWSEHESAASGTNKLTLNVGGSNPTSDHRIDDGTDVISFNTSGVHLLTGSLKFPDNSEMTTAPDLQARTGNITLVAGEATVANSSTTTKTNILLTRRASGGTIGELTYSVVAGVGFTITSASAADTSRVTYHLIESLVDADAPTISGNNYVGQTLTVVSGGGSESYQWYADNVLISGETASTFEITAEHIGQNITCREDGIASNIITAWKPGDESGYVADFRADAGLFQTSGGAVAVDGDPVGQWRDQSGNGNHVAQATAASRPLLDTTTTPGYPYLDFDGTDDFLLALRTMSRPQTLYLVGLTDSYLINRRMAGLGSSGSRMMVYPYADTISNNGASVSHSLGNKNIITARTTLTANAIRLDGGSESSVTETTGNGIGIFLGGTSSANSFNGRIYAAIYYEADHDTDAQTRVRAYLKAKYGTP